MLDIKVCNWRKRCNFNSAYGAIGNQHFRFFDLRQATAITLGGQVAIRWIEQEVNAYMNTILKTTDVDYVIASDTDSLYINFAPFVAKFLPGASTDKIVTFLDTIARDRFDKVIGGIYQELADRMNCYDQKMIMKREVIAERGIWTAKKRYILNVWDSEGVRYKEPKLKIMGIEAVKSSTPAICRDAIRQALKLIMTGDQDLMQSYIQEFRQKFYASPFEEVAFPRGLQGLSSYTLSSKSIPIHVRGALSYNQMLINKKLQRKYPLIREGEKIRFCYLRMPNSSHHNVISSPGELPKEFGLSDAIDMELQFEKAYLSPLRAILDVIGWSERKINTLEEFFG